MDVTQLVDTIQDPDRQRQGDAFHTLMAATDTVVLWSDEVWETLNAYLTHRDNRTRAIAAQLLCNLAKSRTNEQIIAALPALVTVTYDERFVTARHCLQSLWKIGIVSEQTRNAYCQALTERFQSAGSEKNGMLIRSDIIVSFAQVHRETADSRVGHAVQQLLKDEPDDRQRKKYQAAWRKTART